MRRNLERGKQMGQSKQNPSKVFGEIPANNIQLVDFLYLDIPRLDSYISQIQNGTLRSVSKTIGTNQGSSVLGTVGVNIGVNANVNYKSNETSTENATENYDPFHSRFIELFNALNLNNIDFNTQYVGQLGMLKSSVTIRDLKDMASVLPVLADNKVLSAELTKDTKSQLKAMGQLFNALNPAIDITLYTGGKVASGTLKREYLSISITDLIKNYGNSLPGEWFTIGIFDTPSSSITPPAVDQSIESVVDMYSSTVNGIYASADLRVTPIAVFRALTL